MKVLVVGSGAREHALAWKCMRSPLVDRVYCAPGNGGTGGVARNQPIQADDVLGLVKFARRERVGLIVLGPEGAVAAGVGDALRDAGFAVFGPNRGPGRIESSKAFAKDLMRRAGIPTADYAVFTDPRAAKAWVRERDGQVAVKADGLALGKGVVVCGSVEEAERAVDSALVERRFARAGSTIVVEERLQGPELSVLALSDGTRVIPLQPARDFKRALDGDTGPNTGGMGAYSPLLEIGPELMAEITDRILVPAVRQLKAMDLEYRGVLYAGLMLTANGIQVIEFNARFGDPEAQVLLPRLETDLVPLMAMAARGNLGGAPKLKWSEQACVSIVVASGGYPDEYKTGFSIEGLATVPPGVMMFHAGTRYQAGRGLVTSGGRVLTAVGLGDTIGEARLVALSGAVRIRFPGAFFRQDIARQAQEAVT